MSASRRDMLKAALFMPALAALPKPPRLAPVPAFDPFIPIVFSDDLHGFDSDRDSGEFFYPTREWMFINIVHTPTATFRLRYAGGREFRGITDDRGQCVAWEEVLPDQAG